MPAAHDHECHPDGDEAEERAGFEDVQEVVDAREAAAEHQRREDVTIAQDDEGSASLQGSRETLAPGCGSLGVRVTGDPQCRIPLLAPLVAMLMARAADAG